VPPRAEQLSCSCARAISARIQNAAALALQLSESVTRKSSCINPLATKRGVLFHRPSTVDSCVAVLAARTREPARRRIGCTGTYYRVRLEDLMHNRIGLILLAVAFSLPVMGQEAASNSKNGALTSGAAQPVKSSHRHQTKSMQGLAAPRDTAPSDHASRIVPDITQNGSTGAAAGIARSPAKVDPDVHTLNSALPP